MSVHTQRPRRRLAIGGEWRDRLYIKNFVLLLVTVLLLITVTTLPLFYRFEKMTLNIVFSDTLKLLDQTHSEASRMVSTGQQLTQQIYQDYSIKHLLYRRAPTAGEEALGLQQLAQYQHIMRFVDTLYVYNASEEKFYLSSVPEGYYNHIVSLVEFEDRDVIERIRNPDSFRTYYPVARVLVSPSGERKSFYTFFGYDYMDKTDSGALLGAVVVNISTGWIESAVSSDDGDPLSIPGETIIMDETGMVLSDSVQYPILSSLGNQAAFSSLLDQNERGFRIENIGGEKTFMAFTAPDSLGWRYIRLIPYKAITGRIVEMRNVTVGVTLSVLVAGLLLAMILSRVFYRPIREIKGSLSELEAQRRRSFQHLRDDFLRGILLEDRDTFSQAELEGCQQFDWKIQEMACFYVGVLRIDRHASFLRKYPPAEREIYKYAVLNIAQEICGTLFHTQGVDMRDNQLVLLLGVPYDIRVEDEALETLFLQIRDAVGRHLDLSVSAGISVGSATATALKPLYLQALQTVGHRFFEGPGSVLLARRVLGAQKENYYYPQREETKLQDALLRGDLEEAKTLYRGIIRASTHGSLDVLHITISRMTLFINLMLKSVRKDKAPQPDASADALFVEAGSMETVDELDSAVLRAMESIVCCVRANEKSGERTEALIESIRQIICARYADAALGVESIADSLHMSACYTGRIYKQNTGISILEQITRVRMEKARQLLRETGESIAAIAELVGFSNESYFYKIFKKEHAMTPAAFRKQTSDSVPSS